ncbi:MAG: hypothetical protein EOO90_06575 [Pedobacter sp.]|nr:MAG: hypothetical protein EOO90_06575 [Pedobacter sp.]
MNFTSLAMSVGYFLTDHIMLNKIFYFICSVLICAVGCQQEKSGKLLLLKSSDSSRSTSISFNNTFKKPPTRLNKDNYHFFAARETGNISAGLKLNPIQEHKLGLINEKHFEKLGNIFDDVHNRAKRKLLIDSLLEARNCQLRKIFSNQQFKKFCNDMDIMKQKSQERVEKLNQLLKERKLTLPYR